MIEFIKLCGGIVAQNFSAITGLLGVYIGGLIANRQSCMQRRIDFVEKQLKELYSPMVGIRKEIQILSEFRLMGEKASDEWWQKICTYGAQIKDPEKAGKYYEEKGKGIGSQIEYENKQLVDKIIPAYRRMVNIFKENYWLAEEETKIHFSTLVRFVETWERFLSKTHPADVISKIQVKESELMPFYEHLERSYQILRQKVKEGKV